MAKVSYCPKCDVEYPFGPCGIKFQFPKAKQYINAELFGTYCLKCFLEFLTANVPKMQVREVEEKGNENAD